jgi:Lipid A 3-O-deacylase (PagL)
VPHEPRIRVKALIHSAAVALLLTAGHAPRFASAQSLCESCELQIGIGETYHFWGTTGGVVLPITLNWSDSRYELGLFRLSRRQVLYDEHYPNGRLMADPYWGLSLSRRWRIFTRGPVRGFFGFGISAKTESDQLSVTRLNFASQLGVRFPLPGNRVVAELTFRHWSNGGIRLPNHGQDFVTLTVRLNSGLFGVDRTEQITVEGVVKFKGALSADNAGAADLP